MAVPKTDAILTDAGVQFLYLRNNKWSGMTKEMKEFWIKLIKKWEEEIGGKLTLYKGGDPKIDAMIDLLECKDVGQKIKS